MGSVIGGLFGGGGSTTQTTKPDPTSQALNQLRLDQLQGLFGVSGASEFARERPDLFSPSAATQSLISQAANPSNLLGLSDFIKLGLDESSNFINRIALPQILSTAALQGLEGSGFVPEAIGKATAGIALPFLQSLPGAAQGLASSATQLAQLSDFPQQLKRDDLLRRQGVVTSGLTGIPFAPGSSVSGKQNQLPLFNLFGFG